MVDENGDAEDKGFFFYYLIRRGCKILCATILVHMVHIEYDALYIVAVIYNIIVD